MTLQQLRYVIQIAQTGSISTAAEKLFITQPSLSKAVSELEHEMGIVLLERSNRGVTLTEDGTKFLSYARQVIEQADLLESKYKDTQPTRRVFAISAQHYAFVVNAFVSLVKTFDASAYEFTLRETKTHDIIEDVRTRRSELGILYLSRYNRDVLKRILSHSDLTFVSLFKAYPHIFISKDHPLANETQVSMESLAPFPRLSYEQGIYNSFYFNEELHSTEESPKSLVVTDRATLFNLLIGLNGYTISSGILSEYLNGNNIVSVPLESEEVMEIGYIYPAGTTLSPMSELYLDHLREYISKQQDGQK